MLLDGAYSLQLIHYELYIDLSHDLFFNLVDIGGGLLVWIQSQSLGVFMAN